MTNDSVDVPPRPFRFALFGAGRVGTVVAKLLQQAGNHIVGVGSRTRASAEQAAGTLNSPIFEGELPEGCDVVLLGVTDPHIQTAGEVIAPVIRPGMVAWHFAGSLGIEPLKPVVRAGGGACAGHPVQAFPDVATGARRLPGSAWGLTTSVGIEEWVGAVIASDLRGTPVFVDEDARPLWHAAAVTASNGISALLAISEAMLSLIGVDAPERVLGPLAAGTVANARIAGGAASLTGPIVRGETATVAKHAAVLRDAVSQAGPTDAHLTVAFRSALFTIMHGAVMSGRISEEDVLTMIEELAGS